MTPSGRPGNAPAESLGGEAEEARGINEQSGERLNQMEGTLDQTGERLGSCARRMKRPAPAWTVWQPGRTR